MTNKNDLVDLAVVPDSMWKQEDWWLGADAKAVMVNAYHGKAEPIAHADDPQASWSGYSAVAHKWPDGKVSIITDSWGSCSGCCSWKACENPKDALDLLRSAASSSRLFDTEAEAIEFCEGEACKDPWNYHFKAAAAMRKNGEWVKEFTYAEIE